VLREMLATCERAAVGDFEARVAAVPGADQVPGAVELRVVFNRLLDRTDAYVRESVASLQAASDGRFYRRFLTAGLLGAFRSGAEAINGANTQMSQSQAIIDAGANDRLTLADRLNTTVSTVAEQVADAAVELSSTAMSLSQSASDANTEAEEAVSIASDMVEAAKAIDGVVQVIAKIASQTQLLALNATIEAARAGEAGKGFAVVASEVKTLAVETAASTESINQQVEAMQQAAQASMSAMSTVVDNVSGMSSMVDAVQAAVDGPSTGTDMGARQGLATLADMVRAEANSFVAALRNG